MESPLKSTEKIGVGVIGGSGYGGGELLRYLSVHPRVAVRWTSANTKAGTAVARLFPNLQGFLAGNFITLDEAAGRMAEVEAVFVSLPHNESQTVIPRLATASPRTVFIDLGGDFRTDDPAGYREFYGQEHGARDWLPRFVYGFTEFQRPRLEGA